MSAWVIILILCPLSIVVSALLMALAAKFFLWMMVRAERRIAEARMRKRTIFFSKLGVRPTTPHRQLGIDPYDSRN